MEFQSRYNDGLLPGFVELARFNEPRTFNGVRQIRILINQLDGQNHSVSYLLTSARIAF